MNALELRIALSGDSRWACELVRKLYEEAKAAADTVLCDSIARWLDDDETEEDLENIFEALMYPFVMED